MIFFKSTRNFQGKGEACSISCLNRPPKAPFLWPHHSCTQTWIKLETTYKPPQGPKVFSKAPFVTFEQPNWKAIGNNHMVSGLVFFVSSYILVLRYFQLWHVLQIKAKHEISVVKIEEKKLLVDLWHTTTVKMCYSHARGIVTLL